MANGSSAKRMWGGASAPRGDGAGPTPVRCGSRSIHLQLKLRQGHAKGCALPASVVSVARRFGRKFPRVGCNQVG